MVQAELLPFLRIVDYLRQLCAQGRSGTVFLVSDDNRMAQVRLDKGQIASMLCRNRRGIEALGILRSMANARLRFDESFMVKDEHDNLSTEAIFDALAGSFAGAAAAPESLPLPASTAALSLTPAVKATIERVMTQYIGPMAEIICEDHFEAAGNMQALVQLLADEIGAPAQVVKFRADIARELGLPA
ncbi:MAG: hypothetical protein JWQ01_1822 [Massilia sp.]|nr:hypothetical protein [Massilia sp.]